MRFSLRGLQLSNVRATVAELLLVTDCFRSHVGYIYSSKNWKSQAKNICDNDQYMTHLKAMNVVQIQVFFVLYLQSCRKAEKALGAFRVWFHYNSFFVMIIQSVHVTVKFIKIRNTLLGGHKFI